MPKIIWHLLTLAFDMAMQLLPPFLSLFCTLEVWVEIAVVMWQQCSAGLFEFIYRWMSVATVCACFTDAKTIFVASVAMQQQHLFPLTCDFFYMFSVHVLHSHSLYKNNKYLHYCVSVSYTHLTLPTNRDV